MSCGGARRKYIFSVLVLRHFVRCRERCSSSAEFRDEALHANTKSRFMRSFFTPTVHFSMPLMMK